MVTKGVEEPGILETNVSPGGISLAVKR